MASIHETLGVGGKDYARVLAADPPRRGFWRGVVLPLLLGTVLVGFAAIVWLAWRDSFPAGGEPPLIRAAPGPIKRPPDTVGGIDTEGERHGITAVIEGAAPSPRVERLLPREPAPPRSLAEADPALAAPPEPGPPPSLSTTPPALDAVPVPPPLVGLGAAASAAPPAPSPEAASAPAPTPPPAPARAPTASEPPAGPPVAGGAGPAAPTAVVAPPAEPVRAMPAPAAPPQSSDPTGAAPPAPARDATGPLATRPSPGSAGAGPAASGSPGTRPSVSRPEQLAAREPAGGTPAAPSAGGGPWGVQVAAVSSRAAAERGWAQLQRRHPEVVGPLRLRVEEARQADGRTLYRVQGLGFEDRESAARACARLKSAGEDCFVVGGR